MSLILCDARTTGSLQLSQNFVLNEFALCGLREVLGDVFVAWLATLAAIDFCELRLVQGDFIVQYAALQSIKAQRLKEVAGKVQIVGNTDLMFLWFSFLSEVLCISPLAPPSQA